MQHIPASYRKVAPLFGFVWGGRMKDGIIIDSLFRMAPSGLIEIRKR